jgi:8-oxo-dGTP pyrophosphatase MutT (NUDIX family)
MLTKLVAATRMLRFVAVPRNTPETPPDQLILPSNAVHATLESALTDIHASRILVSDEKDIIAHSADTVKIAISDARNGHPYCPPVPVVAAGGYVVRSKGDGVDVLLIRRRGVWDLPKGKLDSGETIEEAALREVREEVGVDDLRITRGLGATIHGYRDGDVYAVKTTYWFLMSTDSTGFKPQAEEQIEAVEWVAWNEACNRLGYDTLRDHIRSVEL